MKHPIHVANIEHYQRLLAEANVASNPVRHAELARLLAVDLAKDEYQHHRD